MEGRGWRSRRVRCDYSSVSFEPGEAFRLPLQGAFREIGLVKERLGVEVQFGSPRSRVYSGCAKMTLPTSRGSSTPASRSSR